MPSLQNVCLGMPLFSIKKKSLNKQTTGSYNSFYILFNLISDFKNKKKFCLR